MDSLNQWGRMHLKSVEPKLKTFVDTTKVIVMFGEFICSCMQVARLEIYAIKMIYGKRKLYSYFRHKII